MRYIKKFTNSSLLNLYRKSNFVAPHIYLNSDNKNVKYLEEYKRLEYISSTQTGGQYINLGCHLMENTDDIKIDIKFNIRGEGKSSSGNDSSLSTLISSQPEVSPWPGFILRRQTANNTIIHLQAKWRFTNSTKASGSEKYNSKYLSYTNENSTSWHNIYWQNIYEFSETLDNIPASQINNCECTLFCSLDSNNNPFRFALADLYYLKFTKGDKIIRNLVPVKKSSTNEIGLYDMENDHFYISEGNDPFEGGPIINE